MQSGKDEHKPCEGPRSDPEAEGYERKQRWKEQPGNRYTAEELRKMARTCGRVHIYEQEIEVMYLD